MPVSKRTRFEVLRRDGHRCRYCGATSEQSPLTVDHVLPVALGGGDGPDNLVAACRDCNSGKASSAPDATTVAQVSDDAIRWAAARQAASDRLAEQVERRTAYRDGFLDAWNQWGQFAHKSLPSDWPVSVTRWQEQGLPLGALTEAVDIAMSAKVPMGRVFIYMCGVVKRRLAEIDAAALAAVAPQRNAPNRCGHCLACTDELEDGEERHPCDMGRTPEPDEEYTELCPHCQQNELSCMWFAGHQEANPAAWDAGREAGRKDGMRSALDGWLPWIAPSVALNFVIDGGQSLKPLGARIEDLAALDAQIAERGLKAIVDEAAERAKNPWAA